MGDENAPTPLASAAINSLGLSPEVRSALNDIQAELMAAYQKNFVEMLETMRRQASALERLQTTLNLLIQQVAPQIKDRVPIALVSVDEHPDLPSALVTADPIGAGYTLSTTTLAAALGLPVPEVSVLVRAFKLTEEEKCAVTVRKGKRSDIVNFHPRAIARFQEHVAAPPSQLNQSQRSALKRVTAILIERPSAPMVTAGLSVLVAKDDTSDR